MAFSTQSLMETMLKTFDKGLRVMQMDRTQKLNNEGYPLIIDETTHYEHQVFPGVFVMTKSEKETSFAIVARAIEKSFRRVIEK